MPFYHCTHLDLENGDIIQPGNWGRIIKQVGSSHPCWNREQVLEQVRLKFFSHKPSRLNATFCCERLDTIRCYKSKNCPTGFLYEVEIIDAAAPWHKGDFNAVEPLARRSDSMTEIALKYWRYSLKTNVEEWPGVECSEIVSASPLKVLRKLPLLDQNVCYEGRKLTNSSLVIS
jgi:hypothetical protein